MGLLDDLGKEVMNRALGGTTEAGATATATATQVNWMQLGVSLLQQFGGLDGLMAKFQQKGFGDLIASWVGTGKNLPISADQIMEVLGKRNVQDVAAQAGTDAATAAQGIAQVLPRLIDKLTPDGQPVGADVLQQGIQALLGGKLGDLGKLFS
ncbi:YidB family protein [Roseimicrobium sp. ORNL1]|uniref:YidB family protein n=1 Tax=Roseimicrobium sp. ORNL1 TaxID=2711231 RepID=UPI0013E189D6|nr:YidB family protein [Roseimicrobium sp. ORNL1]QIF01740.1 DUF937 domain-containing protein [Roseimicrobium sp. ORNL1]